jgi:hypothetical protein
MNWHQRANRFIGPGSRSFNGPNRFHGTQQKSSKRKALAAIRLDSCIGSASSLGLGQPAGIQRIKFSNVFGCYAPRTVHPLLAMNFDPEVLAADLTTERHVVFHLELQRTALGTANFEFHGSLLKF